MLIDRRDILRSPLLDAPWRARAEAGEIAHTTLGLPILINEPASLVDVKALADPERAASALIVRNPNALRVALSRLRSTSYAVSERMARRVLEERPAVGLVVGGGTVGVGVDVLLGAPDLRIVALDVYDSPNLTCVGDGNFLPFADGVFDFVWVQAVLEHVAEPTRVARECERVLKPGGVVYAETPFIQQVHERAYDFARFTGLGHRMLFAHCDTVESRTLDGPGAALVWSLRYFFTALFRSAKVGRALSLLFFWLALFDRIMPERHKQMGASSFYFLGRKRNAAEPLTPPEMIGEYAGL